MSSRRCVSAALLLAVAGALAIACSAPLSSKGSCPKQLPDKATCAFPETDVYGQYQYVCDYALPCGETDRCTCDPDGGRWECLVSLASYACSKCPSGEPGASCAIEQSTLLTPPK